MGRDLVINRLAMVIVIGERAMNGGESQMRVMLQHLFGGLAVKHAGDHHGAHGDACAGETGAPAADLGITDDIGMSHRCHAVSLSESGSRGNEFVGSATRRKPCAISGAASLSRNVVTYD